MGHKILLYTDIYPFVHIYRHSNTLVHRCLSRKKIVQQNKIISKRMYNNIYTSFTMSSLIASWTRTNCWCRAKATIHAFWIAECSLTIWSHVADWTLTNLFLTTPSTVCTFFTTFRIGCFISNDGEKNMN